MKAGDSSESSAFSHIPDSLLADSNAMIVPFHINPCFAESAMHTVRTGMLAGMFISEPMAEVAYNYADAVSDDATALGSINAAVLDRNNSVLGINTYVAAFCSVTSYYVNCNEKVNLVIQVDDSSSLYGKAAIIALHGVTDGIYIVRCGNNNGSNAIQSFARREEYLPMGDSNCVHEVGLDTAVTVKNCIYVKSISGPDGFNGSGMLIDFSTNILPTGPGQFVPGVIIHATAGSLAVSEMNNMRNHK